MSNPPSSPAHPYLVVRPWEDRLVEAQGFAPDSAYVEYCWLPVLGPTATWLYRRLAVLVRHAPEVRLDLVELSLGLGLGEGVGRNSVLVRSLVRLVRFGVAEWQGEALAVRRTLAPLPLPWVARLAPSARRAHERLLAQRGGQTP